MIDYENRGLLERLKKLSAEKARLQLQHFHFEKLSQKKGITEVVDYLLKSILDLNGGSNIILYYRIQDEWFSKDLYDIQNEVTIENTRIVFESFRDNETKIEYYHSADNYFNNISDNNRHGVSSTIAIPLSIKSSVIAVAKIEGGLSSNSSGLEDLQSFMQFAAFVLDREIRTYLDKQEFRFAIDYLFNSTSDGILIINRKGVIVKTNVSFLNMALCSGKEIVGSHYSQLFNGKLTEEHMNQTRLSSNPIEIDFECLHNQKKFFILTLNVLKDFFGRFYGYSVVMKDITDRKKSTNELRDKEERYRNTLNNMYDAVIVLKTINNGKSFTITEINNSAIAIERVQRKACMSKNPERIFPALKSSGILKAAKQVWITGESIELSEINQKEGNNDFWKDFYLYKLKSGEIVILYRDITEEKKLKDNLIIKNSEYEVLNEELKSVNEELRKKKS